MVLHIEYRYANEITSKLRENIPEESFEIKLYKRRWELAFLHR